MELGRLSDFWGLEKVPDAKMRRIKGSRGLLFALLFKAVSSVCLFVYLWIWLFCSALIIRVIFK
ncbi:MAG: hypothetical protein DYG98_17130 [Haliscomenobacteraceae bacterium CHB4]|nr:hypothetical protein [Haliscomenobacteraceae bacterium CHB4]